MQKLKFLKRVSAFLCIFSLTLCLMSGCTKQSDGALKTFEFFGYFDTVSSLKLYESDKDRLSETKDSFEQLLSDYDSLLDIYESHGDTVNLYDVNLNAGKEPITVDERLFAALEFGKEMHTLTNGECNIALGSVISLWHDAREHAKAEPQNAYIPNESDISEALLHRDIRSVILDKETLSVQITDKKLSLDLGAIAKGYVAQKASELLCQLGYDDFIINLGGNILASGKKSDGSSWSAMIENPFDDGREGYGEIIELNDRTLVTSGSYQRFYIVDGKKYSHIVSNTDGVPPEIFASVSIIAPAESSGMADALSTALFCMELERGKELITSLDGVEAIWIHSDGSVTCSFE